MIGTIGIKKKIAYNFHCQYQQQNLSKMSLVPVTVTLPGTPLVSLFYRLVAVPQ